MSSAPRRRGGTDLSGSGWPVAPAKMNPKRRNATDTMTPPRRMWYPHLDRQGELADQVARIRTDDRRAEEHLRVRIRDEFHEAVVLACRQRAADRRERHPSHPGAAALGGRLGLLKSDNRDLRVREDRGGHRVHVQFDGMTGDDLGGREAFFRRLVR